MTHRTRISKAAQRRQRKYNEESYLYKAVWDAFEETGWRVAAGIDYALKRENGQTDRVAIVAYALMPDGNRYIPYAHLAIVTQGAIDAAKLEKLTLLTERLQFVKQRVKTVLSNYERNVPNEPLP